VSKFVRDNIRVQIGSEPEEDFATNQDTPFHIVLIGDWRGAGQTPDGVPLPRRRPVAIDRDEYDAVLRGLDVQINIGGESYPIRELDDFHPDSLYRKVPLVEAIRNAPHVPDEPRTERPGPAMSPAVRAPASSGNLLDAILEANDAGAAPARSPIRPQDDLQEFLSAVVRPHLVPREDPRDAEISRQTEVLTARAIRSILRSEPFRNIEAAWRSVFQIVRRLDTGSDLRIYLLQATKEEVASRTDDLVDVLTQHGSPWAVVALNFSINSDDIALLSRLGLAGRSLGAPVLAEGDPSLTSGDGAWEHFRRSPEAHWVALALPRILLRLPYGASTSPCEAFPFEEIDSEPQAGDLLFGNPALFAAMLLGQSFRQEGWTMRAGSVREVDDLPVYTWRNPGGEVVTFPCAELPLSERTAEALLEVGFIPVVAPRAADYVRMPRFQSVSDPPALLAGRWN